MYGTSLEGIEQLAVECFQSLLPKVEFLDIPGMRPVTTYLVNGTRVSMLMVPNFQPRRSDIVINNYFNYQGGEKDCEYKDINTNKSWNKCEYISSNLKINVDSFRYKGLVRECFGKVNNYPLKLVI